MLTNELVGYIQSLSHAIEQVMRAKDITAQEVRVGQGPLTISFRLRLTAPTKEQVNYVAQIGDTLAMTIGYGPVRVQISNGGLEVEFPSPDAMIPSGSMLAAETKGATLCLGYDTWAEPVHLMLARYPNLLLVGPPRSGKSSAVRALLYAVAKTSPHNVEYLIIAKRMETWSVFTRINGCLGIALSAKQGLNLLEEIAAQKEPLENKGKRFSPALLVVIDDLMDLLQDEPGLAKVLRSLTSAGGAVGVYIVAITQSAGSKAGTGGMAIEDNFVARVAYRTQSTQGAYRSTGVGGQGLDDLTDQQGDALFIAGQTRTRIATGLVTDDQIIEDLPPYQGRVISANGFVLPEEKKEGKQPPKVTPVVEQVAPLSLPVIKPARLPNADEVAQIVAYLEANPISQRRLLLEVFGGRNDRYVDFLRQALTEDVFNKFFANKSGNQIVSLAMQEG